MNQYDLCQHFGMLASIFSRKEEARSSAETDGEEVLREDIKQSSKKKKKVIQENVKYV